MEFTLTKKQSFRPIIFISPLVVAMLLFFIDEGYYDFRWMGEPGNWLAFSIYYSCFLITHYLAFRFLKDKYRGAELRWLVCGIGIPTGLILVLGLFFLLGFRY